MAVVPAPTAVTIPDELTVATAGTVDAHVTVPVMSCVVAWFALPKVPTAFNCAV
jgi:hypothetical protein